MQPSRRRPNQLICDINVAAFASVLLSLLIMYLAKDPVVCGGGLDLAKVKAPVSMQGAEREDAMVVALTRDGKIFFNSDPMRPDDLPGRIRESVERGSEREVYISADPRAKYSWVAEVLDSVRAARVERIGFLVDKRSTSQPNPQ